MGPRGEGLPRSASSLGAELDGEAGGRSHAGQRQTRRGKSHASVHPSLCTACPGALTTFQKSGLKAMVRTAATKWGSEGST